MGNKNKTEKEILREVLSESNCLKVTVKNIKTVENINSGIIT